MDGLMISDDTPETQQSCPEPLICRSLGRNTLLVIIELHSCVHKLSFSLELE